MSGLGGLWAASEEEGLQKPLIIVVNVDEAGDGIDARSPDTRVSIQLHDRCKHHLSRNYRCPSSSQADEVRRLVAQP